MEFFGMGLLEILIILLVGLIAFGPDKLPQIARNLAKGIRAFKKATIDLTTEVSEELKELEEEQLEKEQLSKKKKRQISAETQKAADHEASNSTRQGVQQ